MALTAGTRLGPYEITAEIGAGGMGVVYRARDPRLNRDVAIKVLPEHVTSDPELKQRFEREARTLAALSHPHICAVFDVGRQDGTDFLVMEYLEGETLAHRLKRGALPLPQTLDTAIQIADALVAAHGAGIVHRDLKPGNVMLTKSGVKLLDFGLAKLQPAAGAVAGISMAATASASLTGRGTILGTLHYMAPEQVEGKESDNRTDLFAFGAVGYEMATGKKVFDGTSAASVIAAILEREPPAMSVFQPFTPPGLDRVIRKCLAKNPQNRWQTARDLLDDLKWIAEEGSHTHGAAPTAIRQSRVRRVTAIAAGLIVLLSLTGVAWRLLRSNPATPTTVARFVVALQSNEQFSNTGRRVVAISPDGERFAYVANGRLYLREMNQLDATPVTGTEGGQSARSPFFSPDSGWIGFWKDGQLRKALVTGGAPIAICDAENPWGVTWNVDNSILFGQGPGGIWRVAANGGMPEPVIKIEPGQNAYGTQLLPDSRTILFTLSSGTRWDEAQIIAHSLDTGERQVLFKGGTDARYIDTGHLVYVSRGTLFAVPFDAAALQVTGSPVPLIEGVRQANTANTGDAHFSTSLTGSLIYVPLQEALARPRSLVWVDRQGREEPIAVERRAYLHPRISPDGTRVAVAMSDEGYEIAILDLSRQTLTRLTFDPSVDNYPVWTPDGRHVVFSSGRDGSVGNLFRQAADGTGTTERLTQSPKAQRPNAMTPDGRQAVIHEDDLKAGNETSVVSMQGNYESTPLLTTRFVESQADLSPDGRWIAYAANESGQFEVYVRPFPNVADGRWQVSTDGGSQPVWARNGRELFYLAPGGRVMSAAVEYRPAFVAAAPRMLFKGAYFTLGFGAGPAAFGRAYDVAPDGQRFLMIKETDTTPEVSRMIVTLNWTEDLKRRVPAN